jgi:hypothetical protein
MLRINHAPYTLNQTREPPAQGWPRAKFHHQKNSATSKIWLRVEQRQNQKYLPINAKIGPDERKKERHQGVARICHRQNLVPRQNFKVSR